MAATPGQTDPGVSNWVSLHLVDSHLGGVSLNELNETASLSWWDLDVGDFTKALEERAQFVLGNVAGQSSNKDGSVVWVGELVHWLRSAVVTNWWCTHGVHTDLAGHSWTWTGLVLWGSSGNAHWTVAAVDALHLGQSALLIHLLRESDESVAAGEAVDGVGHDLGGFARWEARLEEGNQDVLVDLWSQVTNEDGELWGSVIPGITC